MGRAGFECRVMDLGDSKSQHQAPFLLHHPAERISSRHLIGVQVMQAAAASFQVLDLIVVVGQI